MLPIAIYHEHPDWFRPLFAELDRRALPYVRLDPRAHRYDPSAASEPYSLVFNRMSPSAYLRDGVQGTFFTLGYLHHLERLGIPVMNGSRGFGFEISKARQLSLLESLGLRYPKSVVVNHANQVVAAAKDLRFPVVVKANVGGSGAGIVRFDAPDDLSRAAAEGRLNFGIDRTALVQEFVPARDGRITRVELLGGKFLYAIHVYSAGDSFNLCPADICQRADGVELERSACAVDAPKNKMRVEAASLPNSVIESCERIIRGAGIDVGGIEFMIDDRDVALLYYDINALSNFVADAVNVVGFDPFVRLVDELELRAGFAREDSMADWDAAI